MSLQALILASLTPKKAVSRRRDGALPKSATAVLDDALKARIDSVSFKLGVARTTFAHAGVIDSLERLEKSALPVSVPVSVLRDGHGGTVTLDVGPVVIGRIDFLARRIGCSRVSLATYLLWLAVERTERELAHLTGTR